VKRYTRTIEIEIEPELVAELMPLLLRLLGQSATQTLPDAVLRQISTTHTLSVPHVLRLLDRAKEQSCRRSK
jgi:hypothetical protein